MKFKRLVAVAVAAMQLAAFAPMIHAASVSEDTVVYSYDYSKYSSEAEVKANGITIETANSYGGCKAETVVVDTQKNVWWIASARTPDNTTALKQMATVDFNDVNNVLASATDSVISVELDFGYIMKGYQVGVVSNYVLTLVGTDADGNEVDIASYTISKNGRTATSATGKFSSSSATQSIKAFSDSDTANRNKVAQRTYLKFDLDTKTKTYDAYYKQLAVASGTATNTLQTVGNGLPFTDDTAVTLSKMKVSMQAAGGSDLFCPVAMNVTVLSDATVVNSAADSLSVPASASSDVSLPTSKDGAEITWASNNTAVITNDGKVTRPAYGEDDATVTLTATITRGESSVDKEFTVTVPAYEFVPEPVPEDGIWVNDDMSYASTDEIPSIDDAKYGFTFENAIPGTDTATNDGAVYSVNGSSLKFVKASDSSKSGAMYKYLAPSKDQNHSGNQIVEFKLKLIGNPRVYIAFESYSNWKGIQTIQLNEYSDFAPRTGDSYKMGTSATDVKVTMVTNATGKTMDIYLNDVKRWTGIDYRTQWSNAGDGFNYFGKMQLSLNGSKKGEGFELDYVRVFEDAASYGAYCLANETTPVIDTKVAWGDADIALPTAGIYNNTITWESDNAAITAEGVVTHGEDDVVVNLTPIYKNSVSGTEKAGEAIAVTVEGRVPEVSVIEESIVSENVDETNKAVGFLANITAKAGTVIDTLKLLYNDVEKTSAKLTDGGLSLNGGSAIISVVIDGIDSMDGITLAVE